MRDGKIILIGRGGTMLVLALAVLVGCSDARKREAGKNLRDATNQARQLYRRAINILSNPSLNENSTPGELDPEALKYLDQAQNLLTASLAKNYDSIKSNLNESPNADAGMANMMLGLIDRLRAQYYIWDFDLTVAQAEGTMGQLHRQLDQAQIGSALLNFTETYATLSDDVIQKAIGETQQAKTKLDETIGNLQKQIQEKVAKITEQKKSIEEQTSKAVALRTEKTLAQGVESQKKLEEALNVETEINKTRGEMQKIEDELVPLRAELASTEIRQAEAQAKITALQEIQAQRKRGVEEITKTIEQRKTDLSEACKNVTVTMAELNGLSSRALELSQKAQASLLQAGNTIDRALSLIDKDKQTTSLSEWANVKTSEGALQRDILSFHFSLKDSTERLARIWEGLHKDKPDQPVADGITAFLDASNRALETAQASYSKAVEYMERAVSAAPQEDRWQYKRELVVTLLDYATVLNQAGHDAEATELRKKAHTYLTDIEAGANRAGKPRSIVALQKYVLEETGS